MSLAVDLRGASLTAGNETRADAAEEEDWPRGAHHEQRGGGDDESVGCEQHRLAPEAQGDVRDHARADEPTEAEAAHYQRPLPQVQWRAGGGEGGGCDVLKVVEHTGAKAELERCADRHGAHHDHQFRHTQPFRHERCLAQERVRPLGVRGVHVLWRTRGRGNARSRQLDILFAAVGGERWRRRWRRAISPRVGVVMTATEPELPQ